MFEKITSLLSSELKENLVSLVLFGSYARGNQTKYSDIDLLVITSTPYNEEKLEKLVHSFDSRVELLVLTTQQFKERVVNENSQLLSLFFEAIILLDTNNFFQKQENLYLALTYKKQQTLKIGSRILSLDALRRAKHFV